MIKWAIFAWYIAVSVAASEKKLSQSNACNDGNFPSMTDGDALLLFLGLSLQCRNWEVTVRVSSCRANRIGLANANGLFISSNADVNFALLPDSCKFSFVADPIHGDIYTTTFRYKDCDFIEGDHAENLIMYKTFQYNLNLKMEGQSNSAIMRKNSGLIRLSCWYNYQKDVFLGKIDPLSKFYRVNQVLDGGSSGGTVMRAFSDLQLRYELDATDCYVTVPYLFYITVELLEPPPGMILQATDCWATPDADPDYALSFNLIVDGCPDPQLRRDGWIVVIENFSSKRVVFGVRSFHWTGFWGEQLIFMHCDLKVCDTSVHGSACTTNPCPFRGKRALIDKNNEPLMMGRRASSPFGISAVMTEPYCDADTSNDSANECQDICSAIEGERVCNCFTGRELQSDGVTCIVNVAEANLVEPDVVTESKTILITGPNISIAILWFAAFSLIIISCSYVMFKKKWPGVEKVDHI